MLSYMKILLIKIERVQEKIVLQYCMNKNKTKN